MQPGGQIPDPPLVRTEDTVAPKFAHQSQSLQEGGQDVHRERPTPAWRNEALLVELLGDRRDGFPARHSDTAAQRVVTHTGHAPGAVASAGEDALVPVGCPLPPEDSGPRRPAAKREAPAGRPVRPPAGLSTLSTVARDPREDGCRTSSGASFVLRVGS